jgi:hypothetical protein
VRSLRDVLHSVRVRSIRNQDYSIGMTLFWVRSGYEHTWWISMYRWRCTGGGGYIILEKVRSGAYIVDLHVQVEMYYFQFSMDRFCGR